MADRDFKDMQALSREVKKLYGTVNIGATGAPTLVAAESFGVATFARTGAGDYVVTLDDKYTRLLAFQITHINATEEDLTSQVASEDVNGAKTITIFTLAAAVAVDPANGTVLKYEITLKNSSVE